MLNDLLSHHFGGKRSFLSTLWYSGEGLIGVFSRYRSIDWPRVSRLVFVCKGNICRSAFAAGKARTLGHRAVSAGLAADPGKPADDRAKAAASRRQVDLADHHSQSITELCLQSGDLLIAFEPEHAQTVTTQFAGQSGVQVTLLGLWHDRLWWAYLHDPYGLSDRHFDQCFGRIERSLEGLLSRWNFAVSNSTRGTP